MTVDLIWKPDIGETVWMNRPDGRELGKVVGYVGDDHETRAGQPIVEATEDRERTTFSRGERKGDRFVIHPMFLLPFPYGGDEWRKANAEGRVR